MRKRLVIVLFVLAAVLMVCSVAAAQAGATKSDLNGVWNRTGGLRTLSDPPPPMTPEGQVKFNANKRASTGAPIPSYRIDNAPPVRFWMENSADSNPVLSLTGLAFQSHAGGRPAAGG